MSENILDHFERDKSVRLPAHVKNLLLFAGFDNKWSLSKMEPEDVPELERIARHIIPHIVAECDQEKYLGYFRDHPQAFCIFPGHKKIILEMPQFYKTFSHKKRNLGGENPENSAKRVASDQTQAESAKPARPRDVDGERQNIHALLMNWINNFCSRNLTLEEAAHVNNEIDKMKVDISREDPTQCFVTCCICLRELKIFRNQNGFWIMSNLHKHFKTHLSSYSNKKFSKNIIISPVSNNLAQEMDAEYLADCDVKLEPNYVGH